MKNAMRFFTTMIIVMAAIVFSAAGVSAITPNEWQKNINYFDYYDTLPNGAVAIVNDCKFTDGVEYKILFGAMHGIRASSPNMPKAHGNNFVVFLGTGNNGYTGPWGYEVFVEPLPRTFFVVVLNKKSSVRPIWFLMWYKISAEDFEKFCGKYVPFEISIDLEDERFIEKIGK